MKMRYPLLLGLLLSAQIGFSQHELETMTPNQSLRPGSSNALSYAADLYTGTVNLQFPFFKYSFNDVAVDIGLSYSTNGIRVDDYASEVGLGFSLQGIPTITRKVKGFEDDLEVWSNPADHSQSRVLTGSWLKNTYQSDQRAVLDGEPDEFNVSFNGHFYTFYIGVNGAVFTIPQSDIKINRYQNGTLINGYSPSTLGSKLQFEVIDEKGNKFFFVPCEIEDKTFEFGVNGGNFQNYRSIQKWIVQTITLSDGNIIRYGTASKQVNRMLSKSENTVENYTMTGPGSVTTTLNWWKGTVNYITSISLPNSQSIMFRYDNNNRCDMPGEQALHAIEIFAADAMGFQQRLAYVMNYAYFYAAHRSNNFSATAELPYNSGNCGVNSEQYRLKLKSITIQNMVSGSTEPYYSFTYSDLRLPPRVFGNRDLYGYSNAPSPTLSNPTPDNLIPYHKAISEAYYYGTDRSGNINYRVAGLLTSITNKYGGNTTLSYKDHSLINCRDYSNAYTTRDDAKYGENLGLNDNDGVCIDKITEDDGMNADNTIVTSYSFSGGQRFFPGSRFSYVTYYDMSAQSNQRAAFQTVYNIALSKPDLINGCSHGYSTVTVTKLNTATNRTISKLQYEYTNLQYTDINGATQYRYIFDERHLVPPYSDKQRLRKWEMGLPFRTTSYDENNAVLQTSESSYSFPAINADAEFNASTAVVYIIKTSAAGNEQNVTFGESYAPSAGTALLSQTTDKHFQNTNTVMETTTSYVYDAKYNIKKIDRTDSKGQQFEAINYYNYDLASSAKATQLNQLGQQRLLITEQLKKLNGTDYLVAANYHQYYIDNGRVVSSGSSNALLDNISPVNTFYIPSGSGQTADYYRQQIIDNLPSTSLNNIFTQNRISVYDAGTLLPKELKSYNDRKVSSSIIDPATANVLAQVDNASANQIAYSSFENDFNVPSPGLVKGNWDFNSADIVTGGMTGRYALSLNGTVLQSTIKLPAGTKYILSFWAKNASVLTATNFIVSSILVQGVPQTNSINIVLTPVASVSGWTRYEAVFTAGAGAVIISGTGIVDEVRLYPYAASMQSYCYDPLFGMNTTCDDKNNITYFQYDDLGNRKTIKDQRGNILLLNDKKYQSVEN